eukprot:SAG11_NODE_22887_length_398_cov_1.538462_1_plen_89_part_00
MCRYFLGKSLRKVGRLITPDVVAHNLEEERIRTEQHNIYRLKETDHIDQATTQNFELIANAIRSEGHARFEERKEQRLQIKRLQQAQQ